MGRRAGEGGGEDMLKLLFAYESLFAGWCVYGSIFACARAYIMKSSPCVSSRIRITRSAF